MTVRHVVAERLVSAPVENSPESGLYIGHIPGVAGAHSQGAPIDKVHRNLEEVPETLLGDEERTLQQG
jgi:predicted RNase H-like HicB family nuclease